MTVCSQARLSWAAQQCIFDNKSGLVGHVDLLTWKITSETLASVELSLEAVSVGTCVLWLFCKLVVGSKTCNPCKTGIGLCVSTQLLHHIYCRWRLALLCCCFVPHTCMPYACAAAVLACELSCTQSLQTWCSFNVWSGTNNTEVLMTKATQLLPAHEKLQGLQTHYSVQSKSPSLQALQGNALLLFFPLVAVPCCNNEY